MSGIFLRQGIDKTNKIKLDLKWGMEKAIIGMIQGIKVQRVYYKFGLRRIYSFGFDPLYY